MLSLMPFPSRRSSTLRASPLIESEAFGSSRKATASATSETSPVGTSAEERAMMRSCRFVAFAFPIEVKIAKSTIAERTLPRPIHFKSFFPPWGSVFRTLGLTTALWPSGPVRPDFTELVVAFADPPWTRPVVAPVLSRLVVEPVVASGALPVFSDTMTRAGGADAPRAARTTVTSPVLTCGVASTGSTSTGLAPGGSGLRGQCFSASRASFGR